VNDIKGIRALVRSYNNFFIDNFRENNKEREFETIVVIATYLNRELFVRLIKAKESKVGILYRAL
jgi:hypothetical protein